MFASLTCVDVNSHDVLFWFLSLLATAYSPLGSPSFDFGRVPLFVRPILVVAVAACELLVTAAPLILAPAWLLHLSYWLTPLSHTFVFYYGPFLMWLAVYLRCACASRDDASLISSGDARIFSICI